MSPVNVSGATHQTKIFVLVEGQSEETFVREILSKQIQRPDLLLKPIILTTKRTVTGRKFKGGVPSFKKVRKQILDLLADTSAALVTTMIDYYGLPNDFPGVASIPKGKALERVGHLEAELAKTINSGRFLPYLALHEFEALILSDFSALANVFPDRGKDIERLRDLTRGKAPEDINTGPDTHPSALIRQMLPEYQKNLHGSMALAHVSLSTLRNKCPHFGQWVTKIESL